MAKDGFWYLISDKTIYFILYLQRNIFPPRSVQIKTRLYYNYITLYHRPLLNISSWFYFLLFGKLINIVFTNHLYFFLSCKLVLLIRMTNINCSYGFFEIVTMWCWQVYRVFDRPELYFRQQDIMKLDNHKLRKRHLYIISHVTAAVDTDKRHSHYYAYLSPVIEELQLIKVFE